MNLSPMVLDNTWLASAMLDHRGDWWQAHVWFELDKADLRVLLPLEVQLAGGDDYVELGTIPDSIAILSTTLDAEVQLDWSPWRATRRAASCSTQRCELSSELESEPPATHLRIPRLEHPWKLLIHRFLQWAYMATSVYKFSNPLILLSSALWAGRLLPR